MLRNKTKLVLLSVSTMFFVAGCHSPQNDPAPVGQEKQMAQTTIDEEVTATDATTPTKVTTLTASISSISSDESTFGTYSTYAGVDYDGTKTISIFGSNFGSTTSKGTVSFSNSSFSVLSISSWADTKVVIKVQSTIGAVAANDVTLTVTPLSESSTIVRKAGTRTVSLCPTVYSRQFQQCTWHASKRRAETGRSVQQRGGSYTTTSGTVNNDYIPQTGDIWIFGSAHQAFVESVTATTMTNTEKKLVSNKYVDVKVSTTTTYTIGISEYNIRPEQYSSGTATVKVTTNLSTNVKTRTGTYKLGYGSEATKYYR